MKDQPINEFNTIIKDKIKELSDERFKNTGFLLLTVNLSDPIEPPNVISNIKVNSLKQFLRDIADSIIDDFENSEDSKKG